MCRRLEWLGSYVFLCHKFSKEGLSFDRRVRERSLYSSAFSQNDDANLAILITFLQRIIPLKIVNA